MEEIKTFEIQALGTKAVVYGPWRDAQPVPFGEHIGQHLALLPKEFNPATCDVLIVGKDVQTTPSPLACGLLAVMTRLSILGQDIETPYKMDETDLIHLHHAAGVLKELHPLAELPTLPSLMPDCNQFTNDMAVAFQRGKLIQAKDRPPEPEKPDTLRCLKCGVACPRPVDGMCRVCWHRENREQPVAPSGDHWPGTVIQHYPEAYHFEFAGRSYVKGEPGARHFIGRGDSEVDAWKNAAHNIQQELIEPDNPKFQIAPDSTEPNADYQPVAETDQQRVRKVYPHAFLERCHNGWVVYNKGFGCEAMCSGQLTPMDAWRKAAEKVDREAQRKAVADRPPDRFKRIGSGLDEVEPPCIDLGCGIYQFESLRSHYWMCQEPVAKGGA